MAYEKEISREFKALFIFLLDHSFSMEDPLANSTSRKADELVTVINNWLYELSQRCSQPEGFKDYFDIAILGYGSDDSGNPVIQSAFTGPLAGKTLVTVSEIANNPARMDDVTRFMPDEATGELIAVPTKVPIWIDPVTQGATPMCSAIVKACEIIDEWIPLHEHSFPPVVINITDGESSEGDPIPYADALKQRETKDGSVLFFNCCLSATPADTFAFKGNGELLPDQFARTLFQMSSVLPPTLVSKAQKLGQELEPNARGMVYNADMVSLINFLELGTRTATELR